MGKPRRFDSSCPVESVRIEAESDGCFYFKHFIRADRRRSGQYLSRTSDSRQEH